jgi:hypothetical protein
MVIPWHELLLSAKPLAPVQVDEALWAQDFVGRLATSHRRLQPGQRLTYPSEIERMVPLGTMLEHTARNYSLQHATLACNLLGLRDAWGWRVQDKTGEACIGLAGAGRIADRRDPVVAFADLRLGNNVSMNLRFVAGDLQRGVQQELLAIASQEMRGARDTGPGQLRAMKQPVIWLGCRRGPRRLRVQIESEVRGRRVRVLNPQLGKEHERAALVAIGNADIIVASSADLGQGLARVSARLERSVRDAAHVFVGDDFDESLRWLQSRLDQEANREYQMARPR